MNNETVTVSVDADTSQFDTAMSALTDATKDFGRVFTSTLSQSIRSGKGFEDTLRSIGMRLADLALNQALKPLENLFGSLVGGVTNSLVGSVSGSVPAFANGGVFSGERVVPFAKGGVVSSPTAFSFGDRLGVMGEAGPEAIMPLKRGSDGKLGIGAASQSGAGNIIFNVHANDAGSFRKSEGQITSMLARAVNRGKRGI
jgi:lambda family phage tail tape measure protein